MELDNSNSGKKTTQVNLGQALRKAREKQGISLDDAAKELFILKRHLQALETEDFESLPQVTFARGFAINYAKLLGLDPNEISQSFDSAYPEHLKPKRVSDIRSPLKPMGTLQREARTGLKINPILIIGLVVVLGLGIVIFKTVSKAHLDNKESEQMTQIDGISPYEQQAGASLTNTGSAIVPQNQETSTNNTKATTDNSTGTSIVPTTSTETPAPTTTETAQSSTAILEFWVKDTTNVSVVDASGKALLQGEQTRGGYKVSGQPPFNVSIDKVNNVSLDLNKQPIKLSQYAQDNQANFSLKP